MIKKTLFILLGLICAQTTWAIPSKILLLGTTTSTDDTGLLDYLAPQFQHNTGIQLKWVAVGTGEALTLGKNCDIDALLVHDPQSEIQFVKQGYGFSRKLTMANDFVVVGPRNDPAHIQKMSVLKAFTKISQLSTKTSAPLFISRGDNSGTYQKELAIWKKNQFTLPKKSKWYLESGQGMMATLNLTAQLHAYTLTDRGTFIKFENNYHHDVPLVILIQGGVFLKNQYSTILLNTQRCPHAQLTLAKEFQNWMVSKKGQTLIKNYKLLGQRLFTPTVLL